MLLQVLPWDGTGSPVAWGAPGIWGRLSGLWVLEHGSSSVTA